MKKWSNRLDPRRKRDKVAAAPTMRRFQRSDAFNYNAAASSSSSSADDLSSLMTRSLEIPDSSFRIYGGGESEMDRVYRSLGVSGPDDLAISFDAWEACKRRSSSDVVNRFQSMDLDNDLSEGVGPSGAAESNETGNVSCSGDVAANSARLTSPGSSETGSFRNLVRNVEDRPVLARAPTIVKSKGYLVPLDAVSGNGGGGGGGGNGNGGGNVEDRPVLARAPTIVKSKGYLVPLDTVSGNGGGGGGGNGNGGGIKGVRPPLLKPPPSMKKLPIDHAVSSWDFLDHLGPTNETVKRPSSSSSSSRNGDDEEEAREVETEERFVQLGDTADEACSFTTNEGDSSSTVSNSSPIYSSGSIITSWQKGQLLGRGSFGSVFEGISGDGDFFAVKEVSLLEQDSRAQESIQQLEGEIALLSQLQHQNIVRYRGTAKDESNLYIFLELVTQGSLLKLYHRYQLMDSQVSLYTRQILDGLNYLHEKGFIHRDIKCANILVDASGVVKLADFGLAKVSRFNDLKSCKGTPFWMAPEVINRKGSDGYGNLADIWSLGCTVLEMLTRQIPYSNLEPNQALFQIGRGNLPPLPETLSSDAQDFIVKCLKVNPQERPTAAELLNHPFVRRPFPFPSIGSGSGSGSPLIRRQG